MPDTYTKEQIADIVAALYGWTALPRILPSAPGTGPDWDIGADIRAILSALAAAEQERDTLKDRERAICKAVGGVSDGGHYRADVIEHLQIVYQKAQERDALKAQVAELEARLQGAADRAVEWCNKWDGYDIYQPGSGESLRAAILGKKEDTP